MTITINDYEYSPTPATAKVNDTLKVVNDDNVKHSLTEGPDNDPNPEFGTGEIGSHSDKSIVLQQTGTFGYHCTVHQGMAGQLTGTP